MTNTKETAVHIPKVLIDGRLFTPALAPAINKDQTLAQYLAQLRDEAGLSPDDVEQITGIRHWSLEAYERDAGTMRFSEAALLARCYGVSLDLFAARVTRLMAEDAGVAPHIRHDGTVAPVAPRGVAVPPRATEQVVPDDPLRAQPTPPVQLVEDLVSPVGEDILPEEVLDQMEVEDEDTLYDEGEGANAPPALAPVETDRKAKLASLLEDLL